MLGGGGGGQLRSFGSTQRRMRRPSCEARLKYVRHHLIPGVLG